MCGPPKQSFLVGINFWANILCAIVLVETAKNGVFLNVMFLCVSDNKYQKRLHWFSKQKD